jgi:alpha-beta hydrolase superfamily lysophospholipase
LKSDANISDIVKKKATTESASPPILFVHGAWHGAWCWEPLMDYMADKGFSSYALDLPGHGSRMAEGVVGLGIMDYVARVESVVAELALANPILIGHSMGGLIVQKYLEKHAAPAALLIAPCPAMGGTLGLLVRYTLDQLWPALTATYGRKTAIQDPAMCRRLFFDQISPEKLESHFNRLGLESSRAIRQMVLPLFKVKAKKITSTPLAVAAGGRDYFFEFKMLQKWATDFDYDFLPFPEAAHNLLSEPEAFAFGETICKWLEQKVKG